MLVTLYLSTRRPCNDICKLRDFTFIQAVLPTFFEKFREIDWKSTENGKCLKIRESTTHCGTSQYSKDKLVIFCKNSVKSTFDFTKNL